MTRRWTAPAVAGVLAAVLTFWLVRAGGVLAAGGPGPEVLRVPSLAVLYAAGPAVLCAVPLVLLARATLARAGRSPGVYAVLGLVGGALVGVAQVGVLLGSWPWQLGAGLLGDMVGAPALGGLVGAVVAGLLAGRRTPPQDPPAAR